jgi:tetratricopeptide (TPR) repeat protein
LIAAGGRALERSDIAATVNLYGRAAGLLDPADPARLAILPDLGRVLDASGRADDAKACFAEALERSEAAGDERAMAHARIQRHVSGAAGPDVAADDMRRVADECSTIFERLGDDRGLALTWRLRGSASWKDGNVAGDEVALARALEHARRAGSHWEETSIVLDLSIDLYFGPTPVMDAIRQCNDILARAPDDRGIELPIAHALAHMHARLAEFELARSLAARCREIAAESGQRSLAALLTEVAADVETLAGDHRAAERILAEGCDWFVAMGQPHMVLETLHALTQVAGGSPVDVERLASMAAHWSPVVVGLRGFGQRGSSRALLEAAMAGAHLSAGRLIEAEGHARSAVEFFEATDFITFHADSAVVLGDVLRAAGRHEEADAAFRQGLDLYRRKGSLVGEKAAVARLAN